MSCVCIHQRYPNFLDLRERFNKEATDLALKQLHSAMPAVLQPGSDSYLSRSIGLYHNFNPKSFE